MNKPIERLTKRITEEVLTHEQIKELVAALMNEVRQDEYLIIKQALTTPYTPPRNEFLNGIITGAIESGDAGSWMYVLQYKHIKQFEAFATIVEEVSDVPQTQHKVNHSLIELGLKRIRQAADIQPGTDDDELGLSQTTILGLTQSMRKEIIAADLGIGGDGQLDVIGYLTILEVALFGEVRYC